MKFLVIVVLYVSFFAILIFGAEKGLKHISAANTVVQIDRSLRLTSDSTLKIACEKATLNYEKRTLTIEGLVSIAGDKSAAKDEWVVEKMEIKDNNLVIYIPPDANYEIRIGPQFHLLAKTSK